MTGWEVPSSSPSFEVEVTRARARFPASLRYDLFGFDQPHPLVSPIPERMLAQLIAHRLYGVGDHEEPSVGTASQPALDDVADADLERKPVNHHSLGIERANHGIGVGIAEHVEVTFQNQQVAGVAAQPEPQHLRFLPFEADCQRVLERCLWDLLLSRRSPDTVWRPGHVEVGLIAELGIAGEMFLGAGDDANPICVGVIGERGQAGHDRLGPWDVQPSRRER
jgi:hypothetical protein